MRTESGKLCAIGKMCGCRCRLLRVLWTSGSCELER